MTVKYVRKRRKHNNILYTCIAAILICMVFLSMVASFYHTAEHEAYEMLHIQTKQIKDDLTLQLKSDRENLITMANFASKLYADGEDYDLLFMSFKPIGLFSNIGILNPDNTFSTWKGKVDLNGLISFEEEAKRGEYISGRIPDLTIENKEIIRSAVPIKVDGKTVGILYGVIHLATIGEKYNTMAKELDAQLFVYDKGTGKFIIDTINNKPGELSGLKDRKYKEGYSYEQLVSTDKGYTSFVSIFTGEDLYVHYSTIEDFDWGIMLARYESQVFSEAHDIAKLLFITFAIIVLIIAIYMLFVLKSEKRRARVITWASGIRKVLLELNQQNENVYKALKNIQEFSSSRSAFFKDTDGEEFYYILPTVKGKVVAENERKYLMDELFGYAVKYHNTNKSTIGIMSIMPNNHLLKTNPSLHKFFVNNKIKEVAFATITDKNNHISILGVVNPKKSYTARVLLEEIAVCFSIAIYNKKHLNRTEVAATTDSLTGALNRVSYKNDILILDREKPEDVSCVYIDVNELHLRNNKYGHAAGDAMLVYIANTLKEVFFGHNVYRMGGDEFLVFAKNTSQEIIKEKVEAFVEILKTTDYKVALGMSFRKKDINCEEMVCEAEKRMYESKAQYYQDKEQEVISKDKDESYIYEKTGIREIDAVLSVLQEHYNGIYRVSLGTDKAHRILMPSYLGYSETEEHFSALLSKYIDDGVHPDFRRAVSSFRNYDAIKSQLLEGKIPSISYKKSDGEEVNLRVYNLGEEKEMVDDTLWVFERV